MFIGYIIYIFTLGRYDLDFNLKGITECFLDTERAFTCTCI